MFDLISCSSSRCEGVRCAVRGARRLARRAGGGFAVLLIGSGLAAAPAHATPLISELFYDAVGSDDGQSFVELAGAPGTPLDGMTVEGINGSGGAVTVVIELLGVIPQDGLFVVADHDADGVSLVGRVDQLANFDFQNGPDSVVLRMGDEILDAVGYGEFDADEVFAGEGTPAPDGPPGTSLARLFADIDTDDNASDFELLDVPTPGEAQHALPEPGSALLLGSALSVLAVMRSRGRGSRWS